MQSTISLNRNYALDARNSQHVRSAEEWLEKGNTTEACKELRKIERSVAGHPAVIQLRRRLVSVLFGWEEPAVASEAQ